MCFSQNAINFVDVEAASKRKIIDNEIFTKYLSIKKFFDEAYKAYPSVPKGCLEAVAYNNSRFVHLSDSNYYSDETSDIPRSYGVMGLVKNGKNYFRENLKYISKLSGIAEDKILSDTKANIISYAAAFEIISQEKNITKNSDISEYKSVFVELSELPLSEDTDNDFIINTMLYGIYMFLDNDDNETLYNIPDYGINFDKIFGYNFDLLKATNIEVSYSGKGWDYSGAIWNPAPECNYSSREGHEVSGVVIHYTAGSYAGCISWFKNCDAQVSAHYVIRSADGQITQMVKESDKAWHARTANPYTIGIEHEAYGDIISFFTPEMYAASANLVRDISRRHETIPPNRIFYRDTLDNGTTLNNGLHSLGDENSCIKIRGHQHYPNQSHTDPGPYWNWNYYFKLINDNTEVTTYNTKSGVFTDSGGELYDYQNDERKLYLIKVADAKYITLKFSAFDLEKDNDFMWIYDGDNEFSQKIGRWNTKSPGVIKSSGDAMMIEFRSDCAVTAGGWKAEWTAYVPEIFSDDVLVKVSPNPANETVNISVNPDIKVCTIDIYTITGQLYHSENLHGKATSIDVKNFDRGIYIFTFSTAGKILEKTKVVIN